MILANKEHITFLKNGKYRWADIAALESFIEDGYQFWGNSGRSRYERSFVRVILSSEKRFQVEVTNCDHTLNEIMNKLNSLRESIDGIETDIKQNSLHKH